MTKKPELARIEPGEFARLEAERRARTEEKLVARTALDKAWREQQDYARAVAELKQESAPRARWLGPAIAAAILVATGALGTFLYMRDQAAEAEAVRIAAESRARREQAALEKLTQAPASDAQAQPADKPAADPAADPAEDPAA